MTDASGQRGRSGKVIRRAQRSKLFAPAELRSATGLQQGFLLDVSISGGQIHVGRPPAAGTIVTVTCGRVTRPARVAWVEGRRTGLAFIMPLDASEVAHVMTSSETGRVPLR